MFICLETILRYSWIQEEIRCLHRYILLIYWCFKERVLHIVNYKRHIEISKLCYLQKDLNNINKKPNRLKTVFEIVV